MIQPDKKTARGSLLPQDERGITGLETAIVLIAFVVVASVFAFAVLTTGLLSSEKAKETVLGGLEETAATISLRGGVVAHTTGTPPSSVDYVIFQLSNASQTGNAVEVSDDAMVVSYVDSSQADTNLPFIANPTTSTTRGWGASWIAGAGPLLQPGERVEITVNIVDLATPLATNTRFTIEAKPSLGAILAVERKTPAELTRVIDLQ